MSYVLFCKGSVAENPYVISDMHKKLYTIEELCYYIYHNTVLCGEELLKVQLAHWIGHQLGFMDLCDSILSVLRNDPKAERIASQIFAYTDYLDKQERDAVCERIRKYSLLSLSERKKMRADYYVVEGNYRDAITCYEEILVEKYYTTQKEKHNILYNIGSCYGRMFYFDLAYGLFMQASQMEIDQDDDLAAALFCKKMMLSEEDFRDFVAAQPQFERVVSMVNGLIAQYKKDFLKEASTKTMIGFFDESHKKDEAYHTYMMDKIAACKAES